jgi:hypothetical protein
LPTVNGAFHTIDRISHGRLAWHLRSNHEIGFVCLHAQYGSIGVAEDKARSALYFRRPSKVFEDLVAQGGIGMRTLALRGASPLEGGIPIVTDGKIVGAPPRHRMAKSPRRAPTPQSKRRAAFLIPSSSRKRGRGDFTACRTPSPWRRKR